MSNIPRRPNDRPPQQQQSPQKPINAPRDPVEPLYWCIRNLLLPLLMLCLLWNAYLSYNRELSQIEYFTSALFWPEMLGQ